MPGMLFFFFLSPKKQLLAEENCLFILGGWKMLTMADEGRRGVRQMMTLGDKEGRGFWLLMISVTK